ncbi:MAG: HesA/MoeB/ThiF family protein [Thermoleophilaceae bacterium]
MGERYSRNEALFGRDGQARIGATKVAIMGLGGLGAPLAQQLAYLGVLDFACVDFDVVTASSLNRLIGAIPEDVAGATPKVTVADRTIKAINPEAVVQRIIGKCSDEDGVAAVARADVVFGCLDRDVQRLTLTEITSGMAKPYFDLATDTSGPDKDLCYGGRVLFCDGTRCLVCLDELDQRAMALDRMTRGDGAAHERIYGVGRDALDGTGPSVVSINGVVASLAVTEFMTHVTGLRHPFAKLTYRADQGVVKKSDDKPAPGCYYCTAIWGKNVAM